ncbi:bifunctional uridylyltransferase/uridylyl-removing enzyme [Thiomicrorhabdus immobilis]|uniref:Bifunctional uridylyltransferase/uridylyl-removing enzyme n=1 Tax=Thiomicrorhabdus immobilis TaxID=2791037 RepID=A0ABN6CWF1_9GAMM|nr:[protein-PII] uridylyltransferase [Thiomicrorhabdus immobilis]BCN93445.1 bifunctional uridylyltransferase/uridylyl-removing enzyme [Thiomicrorhabdus immobilis]
MTDNASIPSFIQSLLNEEIPLFEKIKLGREVLSRFSNYQFDQFEKGAAVSELIKERSTFIDQFLKKIWQTLIPENAGTLIAVGGYGRGELHPYSDIDILILCDEVKQNQEELSRFITFLWDLGFDVGHAIRTIEDCKVAGLEDVSTATNLLESRWLTGDYERFQKLQKIWNDTPIFWERKEFFKAKVKEQKKRHQRFNDTIYQLEPNIKESPGGLRDIQTIYWVAKRHFNANSINELVQRNFLTTEEFLEIEAAYKFLNRVRFALQHSKRRREDRLQFDSQQSIAESFGYSNNDEKMAVEQFMSSYYRNVHNVVKLNEILLQHFREVLFDDENTEIKPINTHFNIVNNYLDIAHPKVFLKNPTALLESFIILETLPELEGLRSNAIRSIRDHLYLIDDNFRKDPINKALFMEIFRQPSGVNAAVKRMHKYGVLSEYLPVFKKITGLMQFNIFHAYTVDDHTILVIRNLRRFFVDKFTYEFPTAHQIAKNLCKPEILFLAGLFHDIAKGRNGAHEVLGAIDALEFAETHNLSKKDGEMISWLVRYHLDFSSIAQKKDLSDPAVIQHFSKLVGDQEHLDYLYLLTVADVCSTSADVWNDWKNSLFLELYDETSKALALSINTPKDRQKKALQTQEKSREILAKRGIASVEFNNLWKSFANSDFFSKQNPNEVARITKLLYQCNHEESHIFLEEQSQRGASELIIYMPDRDYLFAYIANALDSLGTDVVEARIFSSTDHMTLVMIYFLNRDTHDYLDKSRHFEVIDKIRTQLTRDEIEPLDTTSMLKNRRTRHFDTPTEILFTQINDSLTELSITTKDSPGLLARIGCALKTENIRLHDAKIHTVGEKAEDVFLISNTQNQGIKSKERQTKLTEALLEMIERE